MQTMDEKEKDEQQEKGRKPRPRQQFPHKRHTPPRGSVLLPFAFIQELMHEQTARRVVSIVSKVTELCSGKL
jgi:hypothetical protein